MFKFFKKKDLILDVKAARELHMQETRRIIQTNLLRINKEITKTIKEGTTREAYIKSCHEDGHKGLVKLLESMGYKVTSNFPLPDIKVEW